MVLTKPQLLKKLGISVTEEATTIKHFGKYVIAYLKNFYKKIEKISQGILIKYSHTESPTDIDPLQLLLCLSRKRIHPLIDYLLESPPKNITKNLSIIYEILEDPNLSAEEIVYILNSLIICLFENEKNKETLDVLRKELLSLMDNYLKDNPSLGIRIVLYQNVPLILPQYLTEEAHEKMSMVLELLKENGYTKTLKAIKDFYLLPPSKKPKELLAFIEDNIIKTFVKEYNSKTKQSIEKDIRGMLKQLKSKYPYLQNVFTAVLKDNIIGEKHSHKLITTLEIEIILINVLMFIQLLLEDK